jgi:hypothetical protein
MSLRSRWGSETAMYTIKIAHHHGSISHRAASPEDAIEHLDRLWADAATITDNATGLRVTRAALEAALFYAPPITRPERLN